jgi:hypothetical protein
VTDYFVEKEPFIKRLTGMTNITFRTFLDTLGTEVFLIFYLFIYLFICGFDKCWISVQGNEYSAPIRGKIFLIS